jgi:hypothetical protein
MRSTVNHVVFHAPHSHVHHEPHPMDASPIQNPLGDVAAPAPDTWRARPNPAQIRPSPGPTEPGRGPVSIDR